MNANLDLKETEKASYRLAAFGDGTADLTLGLSFLLLGCFPLTRAAFGPTINAVIFLIALYGIIFLTSQVRKKLGPSRLGIVTFGDRVKKRSRIMGIITALLSLAMIAVWFRFSRNQFPDTSQWLSGYGFEYTVSLIVLMILAGGMAYTLGVQRYYFHAILIAACFPVQAALEGIYEGAPFLAAGLIITVVGAVLMFRFLKQYPPLTEDEVI
jgi:hypothetical protein